MPLPAVLSVLIIFFLKLPVASAQHLDRNFANEPGAVYARADFGYGFRFAGQVDFKGYPADGSLHEYPAALSVDYKKYSFGAGPLLSLVAGWSWNKWFGAEIGATGMVRPVMLHYDYYNSNGIKPDNTPDTSHTRTTVSAQPVYATLSFFGKTSYRRLNSYGRIGIAIPLSDNIQQVLSREPALLFSGRLAGTESETTYQSRFSIGLQGAVGITYAIGAHIEICAEAFGLLRNTYAKSSELKSYKVDGEERINTYTGPKHIEYEFTYTTQQNAYRGNTFVLPFSSIGGSIGLKLSI